PGRATAQSTPGTADGQEDSFLHPLGRVRPGQPDNQTRTFGSLTPGGHPSAHPDHRQRDAAPGRCAFRARKPHPGTRRRAPTGPALARLPIRHDSVPMSREHWEKQASNWAAWARTPDFDAYWKYSPAFFELVPPPRGRTLEVGCGEGRVTRDLAKRGHRVVGVDATADLIRLARDADAANTYLRCDAAALPFADGSFDLAVFYNSLMDVDDMEAALQIGRAHV